MSVRLLPIGVVHLFATEKSISVEAGLTVQQAIEHLALPPDLRVCGFANGKRMKPDALLHDGDILRVVSLMAGG